MSSNIRTYALSYPVSSGLFHLKWCITFWLCLDKGDKEDKEDKEDKGDKGDKEDKEDKGDKGDKEENLLHSFS